MKGITAVLKAVNVLVRNKSSDASFALINSLPMLVSAPLLIVSNEYPKLIRKITTAMKNRIIDACLIAEL